MFATFTLRTLFTGCSKLGVTSAPPKREATPTTLAGRAMSWVTCSSLFCRFISLEHLTDTLPAPTASFITPVVVEQVATGPSYTSRVLTARPINPTITTVEAKGRAHALIGSLPGNLKLAPGGVFYSDTRKHLIKCLYADRFAQEALRPPTLEELEYRRAVRAASSALFARPRPQERWDGDNLPVPLTNWDGSPLF